CFVDLRNRGGRNRGRKRNKEIADRPAERSLDGLPRVSLREWGDLVAQPSELRRCVLTDDVGAGRQKLSELYVGGTQTVQRRGQPVAGGAFLLEPTCEVEEEPRSRREGSGIDEGESTRACEGEAGACHSKERRKRPDHQIFQPEWIAAMP